MKIRMQLDQLVEQAPLASAIESTAVQKKVRLGVLLALLLATAAFALPSSAAKLGIMEKMIVNAGPGEGIAELEKNEIAKSLSESLYWGRLVAAINPRLTESEVKEIGRAIIKYSGEFNLAPELIVAIIKVESSGRVSAVSPVGAQGLMQIMPFWKDELGIEGTLFDIDNNIMAGTRILSQYIKRHGFKEGIARYYRGTLPVSADGYYDKVQKAMQI